MEGSISFALALERGAVCGDGALVGNEIRFASIPILDDLEGSSIGGATIIDARCIFDGGSHISSLRISLLGGGRARYVIVFVRDFGEMAGKRGAP